MKIEQSEIRLWRTKNLFFAVCIIANCLLPTVYSFSQTPNWLWAKSTGGSSDATGSSIAVDGSGQLYVTGNFTSGTITFGSTTLTNAGAGFSDIFIAKYDGSGAVLWAKRAGGSSYDDSRSIAVDGSGQLYVTGYFNSGTITFGSTTLTNAGSGDIFIAKLNSTLLGIK